MNRRQLGRTGLDVPCLSLGAAALGEEYGEIDLHDALGVVAAAIRRGIDLIDTSPYYGRGRSEVLLGHALRGVPRDSYRLCTKVGRYDVSTFDFRRERVRESVETSCHRLGVDRIDIVLCHDIEFVDLRQVAEEAIPELRAMQKEGVIGAVGASGYPVAALARLHAMAPLDVVLSYANLTLHNRALERVLPPLLADGVGIINAAPFDMGLLTSIGTRPWHPAGEEMRERVGRARTLCAERGTDLAIVAFHYAIDHPAPASTLIGSARLEEIEQWLRWLELPRDLELREAVLRLFDDVAERPRIIGRPENN
ncbi:MAG: aldo/keto reductase [Planctomycetota bacterium]